jgi:hypothetical protein
MCHQFRGRWVQSIGRAEQYPFPYGARFCSNSRLKAHSDAAWAITASGPLCHSALNGTMAAAALWIGRYVVPALNDQSK